MQLQRLLRWQEHGASESRACVRYFSTGRKRVCRLVCSRKAKPRFSGVASQALTDHPRLHERMPSGWESGCEVDRDARGALSLVGRSVGLGGVCWLDLSCLWGQGWWYGGRQRERRPGKRTALVLLALLAYKFAEEGLLYGRLHKDAPSHWFLIRVKIVYFAC
jgi:hypothetical protein